MLTPFLVQAFQELKDIGSPYHFPQNNQQLYDGYPTNDKNYNRHKSYDIPVEKSWKHADLYVPTQQNYVFDGNVAVYPFGNTIPTGQYIPEGKYATNTPTTFLEKTYPSRDFHNPIPNKLDLDLLSFLSVPTTKEEHSPNNILPDRPLELMYDSTPAPHDPSLESTVLNEATGTWDGVLTKDSPTEAFPEQEIFDPFVNDFQNLEPRLCPAESYDSLFPDVSQSSPSTAASSPLHSKPSPWSEELQELFEKTFDFSDIDIDLILPPPPKRIHETDINPKAEIVQPVTLPRPPQPSTPEPLPTTSETLPDEVGLAPDLTEIKSEDNVEPSLSETDRPRVKSTILFGKHEDEIIHKLLAPGISTSRKPVTRDKLVSMPVEEFNHLLELTQLNDIEVAFMKEWRRRGKNKTAAQIARKRKREEVGDLESEVDQMRQQKVELQVRYDQLRSKIASLKERSLAAESNVYERYGQSSGQPLSRDTHLIHVTNGNKLLLVPRINSQIIAVN